MNGFSNPYLEACMSIGCLTHDRRQDYSRRVAGVARQQPHLAEFFEGIAEPGEPAGEWDIKAHFRKTFAYAIPSANAINRLVELSPLIEIGAGTGYWASLIAASGGEIQAFDTGEWNLSPRWFNVARGGQKKAGESGARCLLLCWPPFDTRMAYASAKAFRGEFIAYVGEGGYGCTGCSRFHNLLGREWNEEEVIPIPQWSGLHDRLFIYRRKP